MATRKMPDPDPKWSKRAKQYWKTMLKTYEFEDECLPLIRLAAEQLTRADEARAEIEEHGVVIRDRFNQMKENPAVSIERQAANAFRVLHRELGCDLEPPEDKRGHRRPGGGV